MSFPKTALHQNRNLTTDSVFNFMRSKNNHKKISRTADKDLIHCLWRSSLYIWKELGIWSSINLKGRNWHSRVNNNNNKYLCNRVHCVCPGPWPFNLFFSVVLSLFWLGGSFMALIIWSVKICALGPQRPLSPSPPGTAEAGHLSVWAVTWVPMHLIQGRAYTVSWLVQIKVMLQQPLTCDSSFMLPTCFPHSPPRSPTLVCKWSAYLICGRALNASQWQLKDTNQWLL